MSSKPFFRFSSDESSLHSFFSSVEDRLNKFNSLFSQQNEKIANLTAQVNIQKEKNQIFTQIQAGISEINKKINLLEKTIDGNNLAIQQISKEFSAFKNSTNNKLTDLSEKVETKSIEPQNIQQNDEKSDEMIEKLEKHCKDLIESTTNPINAKMSQFLNSINELRDDLQTKISNFQTKTVENGQSIQKLRETFLLLNTNPSNTSHSDSKALNSTAECVNRQFSSLFEMVNSIKSTIKSIESKPTSPDLSRVSLRPHSVDSLDGASKCPTFPALRQFTKIEEVVSFIYEFVPCVQSGLSILFAREDSRDSELATHKKDVDKQLAEIRYEIADIRSLMAKMATREDISIIQRQRSSRSGPVNWSQFNDGSPSGGFGGSQAVKCIACGRELPSAGASFNIKQSLSSSTFPENECASSYVSLNIAQQKQPQRRMATAAGSRKFNVGIVENPRSARDFHTPQACRKIQTPNNLK